MPVVGRAQILVGPSFQGFQTAVGKQVTQTGRSAGKQFSGTFAASAEAETKRTLSQRVFGGFKAAAVGTGAAVGGILAFSIQRGFTRLNAIEQAQAKLRGLGHDAESITNIMTSALASVKGTAFGLDEAATAAASAVAAGIKPGKELTGYLKLTADAATIAGSSFGEMGAIINQVTTAGRAQTEDLNQLAERGIPIYQWLAKEYGVSAVQLREMVSKGKVDAATFRKVVTENIGGAALESGNTTQGAFKNMQASLGRVGANLLSGLFPELRKAFGSITTALGPVEGGAKRVGTAVGGAIAYVVAQVQKNGPNVIAWFRDLKAQVQSKEVGSIGSNLSSIGASFTAMQGPVSQLRGDLPSFSTILQKVADVTGFLADHSTLLKTAIIGVAGAFLVYRGAAALNAVVGRNSAIGFGLQIGATLALAGSNYALAKSQAAVNGPVQRTTALMRLQTVATWAQTAAQRVAGVASTVFSVGLRAVGFAVRFALGPVGLIITAVGLLAAGLIYAYKHSATFRGIVQGAWAGIQSAAAAAWGFLRNTVLPGFLGLLSSIGSAATWLWGKAKAAWSGISSGFAAVGNVVRAVWRGFLSPVFQLIGAIVKWLAVTIFAAYMAQMRKQWTLVGTVVRTVYEVTIKRALNALGALVKWLWERALKPAWASIRSAWQATGTKIKDGYDRTIKPILSALGSYARKIWNDWLKPAWKAIRDAWDATSSKIKAGYDRTIKPTLKLVGDKVTGLKTTFSKGVEAIGKAWDGLKEAAKKPVKFVILTVLNGLIRGFNGLARKFGTDEIKELQLPKGFARGGIERGYSSYRQGDTLLRGFRPGEGVAVTEAMRDPYERARLLAMNKAAIRGEKMSDFRRRFHDDVRPPGYFLGGVLPSRAGSPRSHGSNYYGARWAGDFPSGAGNTPPVYAWKDGIVSQVMRASTSYGNRIRLNHGKEQTLYAHLSRFGVSPGDRVRQNQQIGNAGWSGNVRPRGPGGAHLHWELRGGSGPLGRIVEGIKGAAASVIDWAGQMRDKLAGPLGRLKELGSSPLAQMVGAVPRRIASAMKDKASGWLSDAGSAVSGAVGKIAGALGLGQAGANKAAQSVGMGRGTTYPGHLPSMNKALDFAGNVGQQLKLAEHLREKHLRYGISYVISRMRIASPRGGWKWRPYTPITNQGDFRHNQHVHASFYERGTSSARRGLAVVGERQPELVNFRGGEAVAANRKQASALFGPQGPMELRGTLDLGNGLRGFVAGVLSEVSDSRDLAAAHRAGLAVGR